MRTVDLKKEKFDLGEIIRMAEKGPVLLIENGKEYLITQADDFEAEVESLRNSESFNAFLDERSKSKRRVKLEDVERRIEQGLSAKAP